MRVFLSLLALGVIACGGSPDVRVIRRPPVAEDDRASPDDPPPDGAPTDGAPTDGAPADDAPAAPTAENGAFVGAACGADDDCLAGGFCLSPDEGFPAGTCSQSCDRLCPDDPAAPITFCVDDIVGKGGLCVSRCDFCLFPASGCRDGYACVERGRHGEPTTRRAVCWPEGLAADDTTAPDPPSVDDGTCTENDLPTPNAGLVEPPGLGGCPPGMAPVDGLGTCMDRWEAFLEAVDDGGAFVPFSPFAHPSDTIVVARSAPGAIPQGYISGREAADACHNAGKRLCRDTEWTRACRGTANTVYPYGPTREDGVCNDARALHPAVEYFGTSAPWIWSELGHPCINQLADSLAPTGSHPGCVDDTGTHFDLMGNLHEWIDDPAGTFRGGFYVDTVRNGEGCLYRTTAHDVGHWDYSTGFRCCADR